jgi:arylsulfatase A-like enzyme
MAHAMFILRSLALATFLTIATAASAAAPRPNIILVMADDQGWGDMGYQGHPVIKTPHFDRFAAEGVRFDHFHSAAPMCSPTRGSVMTGRTPNRFGCFKAGNTLRPQEVTIAEVLKPAGYRTGHFGKWHLGSVQKASPVSPGASGFDEWVSSPNYFDIDPILSEQGKAVAFTGDSSDITVDVALKFMRSQAAAQQSFFAVVWFGSPHDPHQALEKDRALYPDQPAKLQNFYGEISAMDRAFGRLRDEIAALGIRDNTLLWYNSDNGALPKVGSTGGRRGFKGSVYEGGLLVPCIVEWPRHFKAPRVVKDQAFTADIYPTLLDLVEAKPEHQPPLDGSSLLTLLEGGDLHRAQPIGFWDTPSKTVVTRSKEWMAELLADQAKGIEPNDPERLHPDAAVIGPAVPLAQFPGHAAWLDGDWKLHRIDNPKTDDVTWELYNLADDPDESSPQNVQQPERVAKMQAQLDAWLEGVAKSLNGEDYK